MFRPTADKVCIDVLWRPPFPSHLDWNCSILITVTHAAAGQNGFGGAFSTPAPLGNGNQEEEDEGQEPEEPVSRFDCPLSAAVA